MKGIKTPMAIMGAFSDGVDRANEWLDRADGPEPFILRAEWRARCRADVIKQYEKRAEFLPLLAEWDRGFDSTIQEADDYFLAANGTPSTPSRAEVIQRLAEQAKAVFTLLSVIELLPDTDQKSTLTTCASMASAVASDLSALIGGAA